MNKNLGESGFFVFLQFERRLSRAGLGQREESRDSTEHHTS